MVQNWRLLAILLALPVLSLTAAEETSSISQEIALDETAYANKPGQKCLTRKRQDPEKLLPEEETIRSQPVITPPVAPHIVDGTDSFITADFIWWKTFVDGMEYAYSGVADGGFAVPVGTSTTQGTAYYPQFQYAPGVKVGLGCNLDHDGWDVVATWTMLATGTETVTQSAFAGSGAGLTTVQPIVFNTGASGTIDLTSATSSWKQDFNVIDVEMGRDFFLSRFLTMRPHFGFKTAWVHEKTINTFTARPAPASLITTAVLTNSEHMWGLGLRGGLDTGWRFSKNWMFYGDFAFTNLWGRFNKTATGVNDGTTTTLDVVDTYYSIIPVIEMGFGLSYINWFADSKYRYEARLGWEEQVWLDYNRSQDFVRVGNLSVQGLTLKIMLNF